MDLRIWKRASELDAVRIAPDFGAIVRSDRLGTTLRTGLSSGAVTAAAVIDDELVGYATLVPSRMLVGERWESLPDTFELGSLEVARASRRQGVAKALLTALEQYIPLELVVVFARAFVSHWDMPVVQTSASSRRVVILQLLRRAGFEWQHTDDPEIVMDPLNFLAVRYGLYAPSASVLAFHDRLRDSPPPSDRSPIRAWRSDEFPR